MLFTSLFALAVLICIDNGAQHLHSTQATLLAESKDLTNFELALTGCEIARPVTSENFPIRKLRVQLVKLSLSHPAQRPPNLVAG